MSFVKLGKVCSGPAVLPIDTFQIHIQKGFFQVEI